MANIAGPYDRYQRTKEMDSNIDEILAAINGTASEKTALAVLSKAIVNNKPSIGFKRLLEVRKEVQRILERADNIIEVLQMLHNQEVNNDATQKKS